jgi:hypothetical protein
MLPGLAVGCGRWRTPTHVCGHRPHRPWHAGGVCTRRAWLQWKQDRSRESAAEGAGLRAHGHRQDQERRSGVEPGIRAPPTGCHPRHLAPSPESSGLNAASRAPSRSGPVVRRAHPVACGRGLRCPFREKTGRCLILLPEGESPWTSGYAGHCAGVARMTGALWRLRGTVMPGADEIRDPASGAS